MTGRFWECDRCRDIFEEVEPPEDAPYHLEIKNDKDFTQRMGLYCEKCYRAIEKELRWDAVPSDWHPTIHRA